jgi:hypothetical protein
VLRVWTVRLLVRSAIGRAPVSKNSGPYAGPLF